MNYIKRVFRAIALIPQTFKYSYVPPCDNASSTLSLLDAIKECSEQGKLLVVHLTKDGIGVIPKFNLPKDDFMVITGPFNSSTMYSIARFFPIIHLPYCGLFYCPSSDFSQIQLLDEITKTEDLIQCEQHFINFQDKLLERRIQNSMNKKDNIGEEKFTHFRELEAQLLIQEMENENLSKKEEETKLKETLRKQELIQKFNDLPKEPEETESNIITIRFTLPQNKTKTRRFKKKDQLKLMYDFLAFDAFPKRPSVSIGFPPKEITDYELTFEDLNLSSKEAVYVIYAEDP